MVIADRALTLEEFLRLPERKPPLEYEEGEVRQKVSPKFSHARIEGLLTARIALLAGPDERIVALPELRVTFGGRSVVPDLSAFRRERLPRKPGGNVAEDFFLPPDLAVEILSPKQSVPRVLRRCVWYVDNGVHAALLLDPNDELAFLFRPGQPTQSLRGDALIDLSDVVPGFAMTAGELFGALRLG